MLRPVPGLEERYLVSDCGKVFSREATRTRKDGVTRRFPQKQLSTSFNPFGYEIVKLFNGENTETHRVHRLVLRTFHPRTDWESLDVNHIDGNKRNNQLGNLEWTTRSENILHSYQVLGRQAAQTGKFGKEHHNSVAIHGYTGNTLTVSFDSLADAERAGYSAGHISSCLSGKRKKHKGLVWKRA